MRTTYISLAGLSALIVDDSKPMRDLMKTILRNLGASQVLEASNAAEALHLIRLTEPDFITLDQRMGGIDGVDFARDLRTNPDSPNPFIPILMVTGYAEPEVVTSARDAGVNEFIAKPVSVESVASRLTLMIVRTRPFVKTDKFFGPDRRRRKLPPGETPRRRAQDPKTVELNDSELEIAD